MAGRQGGFKNLGGDKRREIARVGISEVRDGDKPPSGHSAGLSETVAEISIVQDFVALGIRFGDSNWGLRFAMACVTGTNSFSRSRPLTPGILGFDGPTSPSSISLAGCSTFLAHDADGRSLRNHGSVVSHLLGNASTAVYPNSTQGLQNSALM